MQFRGKYYWASNFAYSPIKYKIADDLEYTIFKTAEHLYQALKYIDRPELMRRIALMDNVIDVKHFGKTIPAIPEHLTNDYRLKIMRIVLKLKYNIPLFRAYLLSTKDEELIHDIYHNDKFFGVVNGEGENHLGKMLMEIRTDIKNSIKTNISLDPKVATLRIAGIGSRNLPKEIEDKVVKIMHDLNLYTDNKLIVHTGDADGSDLCFKRNSKNCISYIPFKGFNGSESEKYRVCNRAIVLASFHHPYFDKMKDITKKLMGRNAYQVMSDTFDNLVDCVICYTPDGVEKSSDVKIGTTGGTGLAISLADTIGIPVFNLANDDAMDRIYNYFKYYKDNYENKLQ